MPTAKQDRQIVLRGIIQAWILSASFIFAGWFLLGHFPAMQPHPYARALAIALIFAALPLAAGIGLAARTRHFEQDIDGARPMPGTPLDITLRYLTNTAEQALLFALAATAFFFAAPETSARLLPVMGLWFLIARALFYIGYKRAPLARATGFAASFHPTLALLLAALIAVFRPIPL